MREGDDVFDCRTFAGSANAVESAEKAVDLIGRESSRLDRPRK